MQMRKLFVIAGCLTILGLLLASCAPAAPLLTPKPAVATPATTPAGASLPVAGAPTPTGKPSAEQPKHGGILIIGNRHVIPHFDMHQETSSGIQVPLASSYSLLVQNDPQNEDQITGDLAKSWDISPDGLAYTFRLHAGVKFHDGTPLTPQEVKFNLDRIIFPPKGTISPRGELYQAVDKIEAVDALTLRITLKNRQASFLQLLALPFNFIFAPHVIREKGDMKRDILGTGPFKLLNYTPGVSLKVQRNPDYFVKGRPYLDGITTYILVDETTRFAALRTKQILMLPLTAGPTATQVEQLQKWEPRLVAEARVAPNMTTLTPNTLGGPWGDVRVRQAVNLAIDREAAAKVIRAGSFYPGYGYALPGSPWALPEQELMAMAGFRKPKDQDIAEAKRLLSEAGYPDGFKFTLMTSTTIHAKETAEFSKDQLAKLGIVADIQVLETGAARERLFKGAFEVVCWADGVGHEDPDVLLGGYYLSGSGMNYGKWSNQKFDELYNTQSKTMDAAKRKETVWEMQRILHRESPKIVVTWSRYRAIWWPEVKGWSPGRTLFVNHKFEDIRLAQ